MTAPTDGPQQFDGEVENLTAEERAAVLDARRKAQPVVDETGAEIDLNDSNIELFLHEEQDGTFTDTRTGKRVELDEDTGEWRDFQEWPYGTIEFMDTTWEYRVPKPLAAMFLGVAARKKATAKQKLDAIIGYLEHTLSKRSMTVMMERRSTTRTRSTTETWAELVRKISEQNSARPTS